MSNAVSIVALVLAAVSTATAIYAVKTSRAALSLEEAKAETNVTIKLWHAAQEVHELLTIGDRPEPRKKFYELEIEVVNNGETTEFVTELYLASVGFGHAKRHELQADHELKPHARMPPLKLNIEDFPDVVGGGFVVVVRLARGGKMIESDLDEIREDVKREVEEWNRTH